MEELRASLGGHELMHVGVLDIPRSPSLGVARWAGRAHTLCFPGSLGFRGITAAGWLGNETYRCRRGSVSSSGSGGGLGAVMACVTPAVSTEHGPLYT